MSLKLEAGAMINYEAAKGSEKEADPFPKF